MTKHSLDDINAVADFFYHKRASFQPSQRKRAVAILRTHGLSPALVEQVLTGRRVSARQLAGA